MILLAKNLSILCFFIVFGSIADCQVTVTNLNNGTFLCGYNTLLKCDIPGYAGGMSWKSDGTIIAQCVFGICDALYALPSGDNFTYDEYHRKFYLEIGITHADNGTMYQCDDGIYQDQTSVDIAVPPSNMTVSVTGTDLTVEAGCFYPSNAGRMDVYCVNGSTEIKVGDTLSMIPTTTGCTYDCAGPNIYTATRSILIDNSTGNSAYRIKVYLDGFESYAITKDTPAIYNCDDYNISSNSVQVRLVDGDTNYRGRVEVYYQGQWGTICDDYFDHNDAKVICRMLGLYQGSSYGVAYLSASFCPGRGPIMYDLQCNGNEHDISQCRSNGWFSHNCGHDEDAGVDCYDYSFGYRLTRRCNHTTTNGTSYNYHTTASPVQVRLVGGSYYHGRVEVYYQGQWGTVCDDGFDHNDVKVICRMLGQYRGLNYGVAYSGAYYGEGTGPIVIDDLNCYGYESDILQCPSRTWLTSNCGHKEDVSVNCFEYYQDSTTADVRPSWYYGRTSSPGYPYWLHATSSSQVQVRLVNGGNYYGRVEVYYQGRWGTICDDNFDHNDVKVICRMLGQYWGSDYGVAYQSANYGIGSGPIIIDELGCYGYESDITQCTSNPWYTNDCSHSEDASLNCHEYYQESTTADVRPSWYHEHTTGYPYWLHATSSSQVQVRLVGGSYYYGRVEVYYQGRWGTICDDEFDHNDVKVICRMLGQYRGSDYGVAYQSARYGNGRGPIIIDDLSCYGYESDITQCSSRPWNTNDCNHGEDASLNCHEYYYETSTYPTRFTTPWWYRQTTSDTISIQSAILVTCDESGWDIRIDMYKLRLIYPDARASDIYLGENQCNGIESWNVLRFNQGLRECLTQEMNRNNQLVYSNELVYAEHDPYHSYIIRHYNWTVGVECDISSNMTSSGHIDHNNYHGSHQQVSGQSHFSVNMMFFTDPNYQYKLQYPLSVTVGQDVYVKVFTNATDWNVRMRVHTCYAKPSEYAADHLKYYLIRNGCEVDSNTHIISQSSHETRFVFQDFEYSQNQQGIHVFCDAKFCGAHDYSRDCTQACNPIIRRNVIYRPGDQELETAVPGDPVNVDSIYVESVAADDEDVTENPIVVNDVSEDDSTFYNAVVVDSSLEDEVNDNPVDSSETIDSE